MKWFFLLITVSIMLVGKSQHIDYAKYPVYTGKDLGLKYTTSYSQFKVWSPPATKMELRLYKAVDDVTPTSIEQMSKDENGCWTIRVAGDKKGMFYAFKAFIDGKWMLEVPDPYVKAVGINGRRGAILDIHKSSPLGWNLDKSPITKKPTDAVIYELHVRDASISATSGIKSKGTFLGLSELSTHTRNGQVTGLSHIKALGVTHVHILPFFDYNSVNESNPSSSYNWGYDPLNYNTPEGSYSTNPGNPASRISELKKMIMAFHANGLKVVMDAVYNHTALTSNSYFNQLVPGYYYRQKKDGSFSDATACGNETASERLMMRKFMLESVLYWVKEYHIDGFRFDLMGVHDIETMNLLSSELRKIKPDILLYGEGWTAGASPLPDDQRALKINASQLKGIAVFSDDVRDGIKGSVFDHADRGFATGKPGLEESVKFGIVGASKHPQVDFQKVNYSKAPYTNSPAGVINYAECHDNHCLWDKLAISVPNATLQQRKDMHKLALTIVLTSQGIPFLHAGTEFLRSKKSVENSFQSPDSVNAIDWNLKEKNKDVYNYVQALISMRKQHPAFRMYNTQWMQSHIDFQPPIASNFIAYVIHTDGTGDTWKKICVVFNGSENNMLYKLPLGNWKSFSLNNKIIKLIIKNNQLDIKPYTSAILYQ